MDKKLTTKEIQEINYLKVIRDLGVVVWARPSELVLWSPDGRSQQEEIIRRSLTRLKERGFVQCIPLPSRSGTGYFLTKKGEDLCKKNGFTVASEGHEPSRPGARFHEQILTTIALATYKKQGYDCYFARDLAWAPVKMLSEGGKEVRANELRNRVIYKPPQKMVDAFAILKSPNDEPPMRSYFEVEWSHKDGDKMWEQISSLEQIVRRSPNNRVILVYPSDPVWQTEFLQKIGKAWKAPDHQLTLINYMRKSTILMEKASQVLFMGIPLEGNFKLIKEPATFSLESVLNKERDDFIISEIEGWTEHEPRYVHRPTLILTHTASGAELTIAMQVFDAYCEDTPGWHYDFKYPVYPKNSSETFHEINGRRLDFEGRHNVDDWSFVINFLMRWALKQMFLDPNCAYKPYLTSRKSAA